MKKAIVVLLLLVSFTVNANLITVNPGLEVKQVGIGPGVCSPDPACTINGWDVLQIDARLYWDNFFATQYSGYFARLRNTNYSSTGYSEFYYKYLMPLTKPTYTFKYVGECSVKGGHFNAKFYDVNQRPIGPTVLINYTAYRPIPVITTVNSTVFTAPAGAKYLKISYVMRGTMNCVIDSVDIF